VALRKKKKAGKKAGKKAVGKKKTAKKAGRKADRSKISGKQPHEVYYVARKFGVKPDVVRGAIKKVGNSREKVYAELGKM
jgi:hypothetical protein